MSYASDLKGELCQVAGDCRGRQRLAQAYGLCLFARVFSERSVMAQTEHPELAALLERSFREVSGEAPALTRTKRANSTLHTVSLSKPGSAAMLRAFGYELGEDALFLRAALLRGDDRCFRAFLRGAFLICGNMTDPAKAYHLEFDVSAPKLAEDLSALLGSTGLEPKIVARKGRPVVYFKDSDPIEELLTAMGAVQSVFRLMDVKIYKDIRNKANRVRNCETANIDKTVAASVSQIEDINLIFDRRGQDFLPDDLYEIAVLRLQNPELSLRELGEMMTERITRSGVNHRLRRISEMARRLREEQ